MTFVNNSKTPHSLSAINFGRSKQANGDKSLRQLIRSLRRAKDLGTITDPQNPNFDSINQRYSSNFSTTLNGVVGPNHPGNLYKITIKPSPRFLSESFDSLELMTKGRGKGVNVLSFSLDNGFFTPNIPLATSNSAPLSVGNTVRGSFGFLAGNYAGYSNNLDAPYPDNLSPVTVYIQITPIKGRNKYTLTVNSSRNSSPLPSDTKPPTLLEDNSLNQFVRSLTNTKILGKVGLKNKPKPLKFNNVEAQTTLPQSYKLTVNPGVDREGSITINNLATSGLLIDSLNTTISTASFIANNGFVTSFSPYSVESERSSYLPGSFYNFTDQPTNYYLQIRPAAFSSDTSLPYNISADLFN
jgi:hypothetical protein